MRKLLGLLVIVALLFANNIANAANSIDKTLKASSINKGSIVISVKDVNSGKKLYEYNSNTPMNPASTQKLITFAAALDTLGKDYNFVTELYKSGNNELYFKLSADPFLATVNLKDMLITAKAKNILEPKAVYIDDYILDSDYWGEGWQWDDDLNPLMPKFGSYNLDENLIKIVIRPTKPQSPAEIYTEEFYPLGFVNYVTTGKEDKLAISHNKSISENLLQINGTVANYSTITIPVNNIKRYFRIRLEETFAKEKILFYGKIAQKKLPAKNVYLVDKITHPIDLATKQILQNSNNMVAETVFKLAGGKFAGNTGSINSAEQMLQNYCNKNNLDVTQIRIVDGSGVSKNNLMTADFMTNFLINLTKQENFEYIKESMAKPGVGTLANRMLYFNDNLKAKTGTLSNISAIAGYLKTQKGHEVAFDIMINDPKSQANDKKQLEEMILRAIYTSY